MDEFISGIYFNTIKDCICHWARKCLLEGIELFMTDFFKSENLTERDLLSRVWRLILLAFDQGRMRVREYVFFFFFLKKNTLFPYLLLFIEKTIVRPQTLRLIRKGSYQVEGLLKEKQPANEQIN